MFIIGGYESIELLNQRHSINQITKLNLETKNVQEISLDLLNGLHIIHSYFDKENLNILADWNDG